MIIQQFGADLRTVSVLTGVLYLYEGVGQDGGGGGGGC